MTNVDLFGINTYIYIDRCSPWRKMFQPKDSIVIFIFILLILAIVFMLFILYVHVEISKHSTCIQKVIALYTDMRRTFMFDG